MILTVQAPGAAAMAHELRGDRLTFGRDPACSLIIRDPSMSRVHAEIARDGESWILKDLGSRNGTRLNGRAIVDRAPVSPGDRIHLGQTLVILGAAPAGAMPTRGVTASLPGAGTHVDEPSLVGSSEAMSRARSDLARAAVTRMNILLVGESGTGKELASRLVHSLSPRAAGRFVVINCPAIPASLFEAEVFGVEKGTATGVEARIGRLELADGGTVMLDEVGDLDSGCQAKLLRFLQDRSIERVGARTQRTVDIRVVAATNRPLEDLVARGAFRRDLLHRLDAIRITLPPLRERREDIDELVAWFLARLGDTRPLDPGARARLLSYDFPGNVRELENAVERASLFATGSAIATGDLPESIRKTAAPLVSDVDALHARLIFERESFWTVVRDPFLKRELSRETVRALVARLHAEAGGSYRGMAHLLGIPADHGRLVDFLGRHRLGVSRTRHSGHDTDDEG